MLKQLNSTETVIGEEEAHLARLEQEYAEGYKSIQQSLVVIQPVRSEIESISNLNEALTC
jgi:hypothetical protein